MPKYTTIIGMEIHVELKTDSKMFCGCKNDPFDSKPNIHICPVCTGQPGTLPVPNKKALEWIVKIGTALNCTTAKLSKFDRKHYFYPDLPKAYQISQYDEPVCENGHIDLNFVVEDNHRDVAHIGITRVHMEEDTATLTHNNCHSERSEESKTGPSSQAPQDDSAYSLVNFNRAGVPLVEIVSDPDIQSSTEAKKYCQELQLIFRYLEISNADMEKGQMRCEANISIQETGKFKIKDGLVKPIGDYKLNNKVELKNLNSFKAIERGIEFEIKRQTEMLDKGEDWIQQTRGWNDKKQETVMQREKETAADYRYFPEPDIPPFEPLKIAGDVHVGELPQKRRSRFMSEYGFSFADAEILTKDKKWSGFTEEVMSELIDWLHSMPEVKGETTEIKKNKKEKIARLAGGWLTSKLVGVLSDLKKDIRTLKVKPENFAELIALIYTDKVNSTNAQKILQEMVETNTDKDPTHIMEDKGYGQVDDESKLNEIVQNIIKNYPKEVTEYKAGKEPIIKFLVGMAMKASEGSANPQKIEEMLKQSLI